MSKFLSTLDLRLVCHWSNQGRGEWEYLTDFSYYSDLLGYTTTIPKGFRYDKASVPRLPVAFALYGERYSRSAGLHDWYCRNKAIPRKVADKLFLEAMRLENEEEIAAMIGTGAAEEEIQERRGELEGQAQTMYLGVRLGSLI